MSDDIEDEGGDIKKNVIDLLSRRNREHVFYIMGTIERVYFNCFKINDGEDVEEALGENIELLNFLINFFYEYIEDEKTEEEFIDYVFDKFNLELDKRKHGVDVAFDTYFDVKDDGDGTVTPLFPDDSEKEDE